LATNLHRSGQEVLCLIDPPSCLFTQGRPGRDHKHSIHAGGAGGKVPDGEKVTEAVIRYVADACS